MVKAAKTQALSLSSAPGTIRAVPQLRGLSTEDFVSVAN